MARHESAIKRHRQSLKRRNRNQQVKSKLKTLIKKFRTALSSNNREVALAELREVNRALDKAVSQGVVKRNAASRGIARLSRRVHLLSAGTSPTRARGA